MTDEERSIVKRSALEMAAKISGRTVEEVERIVNEKEEQSQKTVRILSMREVESAVSGALANVLGSMSILVGPIILDIVRHELFDKQEGE